MAADFDYTLDYNHLDFRKHPELYRVGRGEQGVLSVEPYKSEILPYWRFKTPDIAQESAEKIFDMFLQYRKAKDFIGMDMARKFLQMGFTRSRRYTNHAGGRKYEGEGEDRKELPRDYDPVKAESAAIFYEYYRKAWDDPEYQTMKKEWIMTTAKKSTEKKKKKKTSVKKKKTSTKKKTTNKTVSKSKKKASKKTTKKVAKKKSATKKKSTTVKKKKTKAKVSKKKTAAKGLYANIHKAQARAARGGRPTRKKGEAGAPREKDFKKAAKTAKK